MLENIKLLLGITDTSKDSILNLLITRCTDEAVSFTNNSTIATTIPSVIINMVIFQYNRLNTEGMSSEGYNGASFSYAAEYPSYITDTLKTNRKIRVITDD